MILHLKKKVHQLKDIRGRQLSPKLRENESPKTQRKSGVPSVQTKSWTCMAWRSISVSFMKINSKDLNVRLSVGGQSRSPKISQVCKLQRVRSIQLSTVVFLLLTKEPTQLQERMKRRPLISKPSFKVAWKDCLRATHRMKWCYPMP